MERRTFLGTALTFAAGSPLSAATRRGRWDDAADVLARATAVKQVAAAVLHVVQKEESFTRHFGTAASADAMFLLGSISKPINVTAVMTLFDQGKFRLDDRVKKFLPAFTGDGRDDVTIRHLLTHVSGLPDQLANNYDLRKQHAPLKAFVDEAIRARLDFAPGARYQYSSMGILLAARLWPRRPWATAVAAALVFAAGAILLRNKWLALPALIAALVALSLASRRPRDPR